jgi:hypothetical protein
MTRHEKFIHGLRAKAKKARQSLGPQAEAATHRPKDYCEMSPQAQWDVDKRLGILDWDGEWNT